jgi:hypothetical protein
VIRESYLGEESAKRRFLREARAAARARAKGITRSGSVRLWQTAVRRPAAVSLAPADRKARNRGRKKSGG